MTATPVDFGDRVRILMTDATRTSGHAGLVGQCYGITTPSLTGVQVVGLAGEDRALNVYFDDGGDAWFAPEVVELVDHGAGTEVTIGDTRLVRDEHGDWQRPARNGIPDGAQ